MELLVVIAVIGILIGLLLPAVQTARESARRSTCSNNIKQLGLALHNYHDANGKFPSGGRSTLADKSTTTNCNMLGGSGSNASARAPWSVPILPFLDDQARYDKFKLDVPFHGWDQDGNKATPSTNYDEQMKPNPAFQCPSDKNNFLRYPASNDIQPNTNYFAVSGGGDKNGSELASTFPSGSACRTSLPAGSPKATIYCNGIFFHMSETRIKDITDGTSKTFMVGETRYNLVASISNSAIQSWASGFRLSSSASLYSFASISAAAVMGPNSSDIDPLVAGEGATQSVYTTTFGSWHRGGCHFAMADASVQFVGNDIDLATYRTLGTIKDGLPTRTPAY